MATHIAISLPEHYSYVLAVVSAIAFHCLLVGFGAGAKRRSLFYKELMTEHFEKQHNKECKQAYPKGGYPDHGNGLYSDKLSYKDWYNFNCD